MSENKNNTNVAEKENSQSKFDKLFMNVRKSFWVGISIIAILLILSIVVLSVIIVEYARADERSVLLRTNMDEKLDIFSIEYKNAIGEITVSGANGEKVIAPGTDVEYTIRIKNTDRIALDYELLPEMELIGENEIPIVVRILDPDDNYILGSAKEWASIDELNGTVHRNTIARDEAVEYTFQWKWPFDSQNDDYDTFLGGLGASAGIKVSFNIHAMSNTSMDANGGFVGSGMAKAIALLLVAIMLLVAIILLVRAILKRKGEITPTPPPAPVVAPAPEPVPEVAPVIVHEEVPVKKEGFYGNMAYINLDVLNENFESGAVITLRILKEKGLLPEKAKQMKILNRNGYKLEKSFIIETQGISTEARRTVVEAGGMVFITKG